MVLDLLINPRKIKSLWSLYFIGVVYGMIAAFFSYFIFESYVGVVMVALTAISSAPFVHAAIEMDEKGRTKAMKQISWVYHSGVIKMFLVLFLGFVTIFGFLYGVLPTDMSESMFEAQIDAILETHTATGNFIMADQLSSFQQILFNNLKVLLICIVFSFFYGLGAIFVLSWNASVMGVAIGSAVKNTLQPTVIGHFNAISSSLAGYMLHGVPEVVAYFVAALAGGIISFALIKEDYMSKEFKKVALDASQLIAYSVIILIVAGLVEVFISPSLLI